MIHFRSKGFTLIELLIVVAIIGILAAIAIPNFLQAQVRSKFARVLGDHNTLGTTFELYKVDQGYYPPATRIPSNTIRTSVIERYVRLTTPIDYMSSIPLDPFFLKIPISQIPAAWGGRVYDYFERDWTDRNTGHTSWGPDSRQKNALWFVNSFGPNQVGDQFIIGGARVWIQYDPTNGTISAGDSTRFGP